MPHTFSVNLKQHTPLIHFQHDQDEATIRASEVKPRLDRFIIAQAFDNCFEKSEKYLIGYNPERPGELKGKWEAGFRSLAYKLRVKTISKLEVWNMGKGKSYYPSFFANQNVEPYKIKKIVAPSRLAGQETENGDIRLVFSTRHPELLEKIKASIHDFFLTHSFGTRQTKGFGCFFPIDNAISHIDDERIRKYYRFTMSIPLDDNKQERLYQTLDKNLSFFYKTIRSGINIEPFYFKSLMFFYAIFKQKYYDKRAIKEHFGLFANRGTFPDRGQLFEASFQYNFDDARLYRDMLGLSSSQSWEFSKKAVISKENGEIRRFKSPLLIKPFLSRVYLNNENGNKKYAEFIVLLIPSVIPSHYYNQQFTIKKDRNDQKQFPLKTPSQKEFSLDGFLKYSFSDGEEGSKKAIEQLTPLKDPKCSKYTEWVPKYVEDKKRKIENDKSRHLSDEEIQELEKEAREKVDYSIQIADILLPIFEDIHCPE